MTDTDRPSPCHPDTTLYADRYGYLTCACGRAYQRSGTTVPQRDRQK